LKDARTHAGQPLQQRRGVLVAAVLGPEQRENRKLEVVRLALQKVRDSIVFGVGQTERTMERLFEDPRQEIESSRAGGRVDGR
jgi:hypothetical protein